MPQIRFTIGQISRNHDDEIGSTVQKHPEQVVRIEDIFGAPTVFLSMLFLYGWLYHNFFFIRSNWKDIIHDFNFIAISEFSFI